MAMNVELREKPRVFEVWVGENSIGEVTSYVDDDNNDDDDPSELYEAHLYQSGDKEENIDLGWYSTLRIAALSIIEYAHGWGKIDKVVKRKV